MEISRNKTNQLSFKHGGAVVNFLLETDGSFNIEVLSDQSTNLIDRAGEYEYSGINVTALELTNDKYIGRINVCNIGLENNIDFLFIFKDIESLEPLKDKLKAVNVYVTNNPSVSSLKNVGKALQPEKVIILENFNGANNSEDIEKVKNEFAKVEKNEGNKIKFKDIEFNTEEDVVQAFFIL